MFLSTDFLAIKYGVHDKIASFFVDREPPPNNLYWHKKLLYLRFEPGYIFIPTMVDGLYRLGIKQETLLSDVYINLLESIGHIAALQETEQITYEEAIEKCIELCNNKVVNSSFYSALISYMQGKGDNFIKPLTMPFSALHRGDFFLFSLVVLDFNQEKAQQIVAFWFALIGSFLLLDDAEDVEIDKKNNDENAFLQSGLDKVGIEKIKRLLGDNLKILKKVNPTLARSIDTQFVKMAELPHIHQYLNQ